jgi:hypothetical protein
MGLIGAGELPDKESPLSCEKIITGKSNNEISNPLQNFMPIT